ncbi:hypothetical protein [Streptomyces sp. NPDC058678]|uniref:hypothetical protein n=1 Tax=Streptomyces sp. NPDC058678 TaxID=3346595 RepID=UPI003663E178
MKKLVRSRSVTPVTPTDIARWADAFGFAGFGSTEQHFATEGGANMPNSLLLYVKLAAQTRQLVFTPLSRVLPARIPPAGCSHSPSGDPLRCPGTSRSAPRPS